MDECSCVAVGGMCEPALLLVHAGAGLPALFYHSYLLCISIMQAVSNHIMILA